MKVNQIIDEMQASLTKLRGHFRKMGMATEDIAQQVPLHYCTCLNEIPCPVHDRNYQELKKKLTGTAGECTCAAPRFPHPDCPQHGWEMSTKKAQEEYRCKKCGRTSNVVKLDSVCPFCTPDLPLNVRVAKALGESPQPIHTIEGLYWGIHKGGKEWKWSVVPDYPNDLVAAMGALEEYMSVNKTHTTFYVDYRGFGYISIGGEMIRYENRLNSQAICEAIVAHAEGK